MRSLSLGLALLASCTAAPAPTGEVAEEVRRQPTTLTLEVPDDLDAVDPVAAYSLVSWQLEYATCAKLVNYADAGGPSKLMPEIAEDMPRVSRDGLTYTFTLRRDFRFSPPSNERVTPEVVKRSLERSKDPDFFGPKNPGYGSFYLSDVVAIDVLRDNRLRFTLANPSGDFVDRLAVSFYCVVPSSYPDGFQTQPPASAGPYYVKSYTPAQFDDDGNAIAQGETVLERNPNYHGCRPSGFDQIRYVTGAPASPDEVIAGTVDYLPDGVGADPDLLATYGPGTRHQRLFVNPQLGYRYLAINEVRNPGVDLRRAVNYAVNRKALADQEGALANDNYLPPGIPGAPTTHMYPLDGPDLATAAALLHGAHPSLVFYVADRPIGRRIADKLTADLTAAGFVITQQLIDGSEYYDRVGDPTEPYDLALGGWFADYPDPANFLGQLLAEGLTNPNNIAHFDDPAFNARLAAAAQLTGSARQTAYGQLDTDLMAAAPMTVLYDFLSYDFFSRGVGCQVYQGTLGIDLAALCPRR